MEAKELRIGNLVEYKITDSQDERKEWWELNPIDVFDLQHLVEFPEDGFFRPIPLTEDWLLKFGFKAAKNIIPIYDLGLTSIYLESDSYPEGRVYFNSWCIIKKKPKYVHQLQNLYFALTGEELTIKN